MVPAAHLSPIERQLVDRLRDSEQLFVDLQRDREWLDELSADPVSLMYRMRKKGLAHQLQAGRYAVNLHGEPSLFPVLDSLEDLAPALLDRLGRDYFLSWHSALWHHGLIDQQAQRLFVAVPKQKRDAHIGRLEVRFVQPAARKFFGWEVVETGAVRLQVAGVEKALLDSFDLPRYAAPVSIVAEALKIAYREGRLDPERLVSMALRFESVVLNRRLGFFMDFHAIPGADPLLAHLGRDWAVPLEPGGRVDVDKTPVDRRWRVAQDPMILAVAERRR